MYQKHFSDRAVIRINEDGTLTGIPFDPANTDYQAYLKYVEDGGEVLPAETEAVTWDTIRAKRDQLIRESDYTMTPGATVDQAQWAAYRQILRDLPQTYAETGPESVVWPQIPSPHGPNTEIIEVVDEQQLIAELKFVSEDKEAEDIVEATPNEDAVE